MRGRRLRGWAWLVWLLVPVLLVGCNRRGGGSHHNGSSDHSVSSGRSGGADGPDIGDLPLPEFGSSDGGSGGSSGGTAGSGSTSGGSAYTPDAPTPTPTPEPTDPTEEAFLAVDTGSCLPVYRDGSDWNVPVPPNAVSCTSDRGGLFQVTSRSTERSSCPTGTGRDSWSHYSSITGNTTTLCLNRVWVKNYCVLAEGSANGVSSIGSTTAVDCYAARVPVPYNQILVIAGAYSVPASGADTSNCPTGPRDNHRYWSLYADDGKTLVCFTTPN
ncbi:hypothetical protein LO772_06555 [Yinghuangia sp. ASG 101]|uniref:hypothetical protein n=1 Tax=Yinghuangia sp. ASG 101 TaxID=2896848 RepID=UPI001E5A94FB|nr:hypothetical protein [Yinghuangia sp. ASG 101]UGQ13274.1 hypothetical protein LO772_06555 [Yinghuangia sp. ASG 101]